MPIQCGWLPKDAASALCKLSPKHLLLPEWARKAIAGCRPPHTNVPPFLNSQLHDIPVPVPRFSLVDFAIPLPSIFFIHRAFLLRPTPPQRPPSDRPPGPSGRRVCDWLPTAGDRQNIPPKAGRACPHGPRARNAGNTSSFPLPPLPFFTSSVPPAAGPYASGARSSRRVSSPLHRHPFPPEW